MLIIQPGNIILLCIEVENKIDSRYAASHYKIQKKK